MAPGRMTALSHRLEMCNSKARERGSNTLCPKGFSVNVQRRESSLVKYSIPRLPITQTPLCRPLACHPYNSESGRTSSYEHQREEVQRTGKG